MQERSSLGKCERGWVGMLARLLKATTKGNRWGRATVDNLAVVRLIVL